MPRKKLPPIKTLEKRLDKVFSLWIRARDGACVVCGSKESLNNGHLFTRRAKSTRWDELNCNAQCWPCNFRHEFDPYPYNSWFIRKYGQDAWDELHLKHVTPLKFSRSELEQMLEHYADTSTISIGLQA